MPQRVRAPPPLELEKGESYCENTKKPSTSYFSFDPIFLSPMGIVRKQGCLEEQDQLTVVVGRMVWSRLLGTRSLAGTGPWNRIGHEGTEILENSLKK